MPCQGTQVFQMQLLVIQFTVKIFHMGFMQVLVLQSLKSQYYKNINIVLFYNKMGSNLFVATFFMKSVYVVDVYILL
jgi:hypothetical protein